MSHFRFHSPVDLHVIRVEDEHSAFFRLFTRLDGGRPSIHALLVLFRPPTTGMNSGPLCTRRGVLLVVNERWLMRGGLESWIDSSKYPRICRPVELVPVHSPPPTREDDPDFSRSVLVLLPPLCNDLFIHTTRFIATNKWKRTVHAVSRFLIRS